MGAVLVAAMVQGGVGEPSSEKLHPFFVKVTGNDIRSTPSATDVKGTVGESPRPDSGDEGRDKKRRKTDSGLLQDEAREKRPRQKRRTGAVGEASMESDTVNHPTVPQPMPTQAESTGMARSIGKFPTPPLSDTPTKQPVQPLRPGQGTVPSAAPDESLQPTSSKTRKVLKFNPKTGTLGSPPKLRQKKKAVLMACIRYGRDEASRKDIGDKITQILDGKLQYPSTPTRSSVRRAGTKSTDSTAKQTIVPKTTHPFFASKGTPQPSAEGEAVEVARKSPARKHSVFMSTPVSPRKQRNPFAASDGGKMPQFGIKQSAAKIPGAMYPMWPPAGMSHVRGQGSRGLQMEKSESVSNSWRKSKGHVTTITSKESILSHVVDRLDLNMVRSSLPRDEATFTPAPAELRLPQRCFESGLKLQKKIKRQLGTHSLVALTSIDDSSQDELAAAPRPRLHPAISRHFDSLTTRLSAYDKSSCESLSWTQKYAPTAATQVLQPGKEAIFLKQWLGAMKVQSVETGGDSSVEKIKAKSDGAPKEEEKENQAGRIHSGQRRQRNG